MKSRRSRSPFRLGSDRPATDREAVWQALRATWGFNLGAASGRVIGRSLGLALFGAPGLVIGEVLGEHVGATAGLTAMRR